MQVATHSVSPGIDDVVLIGAAVLDTGAHVVLLGIFVVALGAGAGVLVSISCVPSAAHSAEHASRHGCTPAAAEPETSHTATHNASHRRTETHCYMY